MQVLFYLLLLLLYTYAFNIILRCLEYNIWNLKACLCICKYTLLSSRNISGGCFFNAALKHMQLWYPYYVFSLYSRPVAFQILQEVGSNCTLLLTMSHHSTVQKELCIRPIRMATYGYNFFHCWCRVSPLFEYAYGHLKPQCLFAGGLTQDSLSSVVEQNLHHCSFVN